MLLLVCVLMLVWAPTAYAQDLDGPNPLEGITLYNDPEAPAMSSWRHLQRQGRTRQADLIWKIAREPRAVRRCLTARDQHDGRRLCRGREALGHGEAVETGKLDVEQDDVGSQPLGLRQRFGAARGLAHDHEPLRLEERACGHPEVVVIVDDEHGRPHGVIVANLTWAHIVANRNGERSRPLYCAVACRR